MTLPWTHVLCSVIFCVRSGGIEKYVAFIRLVFFVKWIKRSVCPNVLSSAVRSCTVWSHFRSIAHVTGQQITHFCQVSCFEPRMSDKPIVWYYRNLYRAPYALSVCRHCSIHLESWFDGCALVSEATNGSMWSRGLSARKHVRFSLCHPSRSTKSQSYRLLFHTILLYRDTLLIKRKLAFYLE